MTKKQQAHFKVEVPIALMNTWFERAMWARLEEIYGDASAEFRCAWDFDLFRAELTDAGRLSVPVTVDIEK